MGLLVWIFWCDVEKGAGVDGAKAEEVLVGFFTVGQVGSALALSLSLSLFPWHSMASCIINSIIGIGLATLLCPLQCSTIAGTNVLLLQPSTSEHDLSLELWF